MVHKSISLLQKHKNMKKQMSIGNLKISEAMPFLIEISKSYGLKINKLQDFQLARRLLAVIYLNNK